jgi:hypothetical protein
MNNIKNQATYVYVQAQKHICTHNFVKYVKTIDHKYLESAWEDIWT